MLVNEKNPKRTSLFGRRINNRKRPAIYFLLQRPNLNPHRMNLGRPLWLLLLASAWVQCRSRKSVPSRSAVQSRLHRLSALRRLEAAILNTIRSHAKFLNAVCGLVTEHRGRGNSEISLRCKTANRRQLFETGGVEIKKSL